MNEFKESIKKQILEKVVEELENGFEGNLDELEYELNSKYHLIIIDPQQFVEEYGFFNALYDLDSTYKYLSLKDIKDPNKFTKLLSWAIVHETIIDVGKEVLGINKYLNDLQFNNKSNWLIIDRVKSMYDII